MTSFKLIQNASYATISDAWKNESYTLLIMQIERTFAEADIRVEARIIPNGEWKEISVFGESVYEFVPMPITAPGIYQAAIEGIAEIRIRVVSVSGGSVNIDGVFYDSSDGRRVPSPMPITNNPSSIFSTNAFLLVKGIPEVFYIDPDNGNIVGHEHKGTESTEI